MSTIKCVVKSNTGKGHHKEYPVYGAEFLNTGDTFKFDDGPSVERVINKHMRMDDTGHVYEMIINSEAVPE